MRSIVQYIPFQLSLFLVSGVLLSKHYTVDNALLSLIIIGLLFVLIALYFTTRKKIKYHWIFQFISYVSILLIGFTRGNYQKAHYQPTHYSHSISKKNKIVFQIQNRLKSTTYYDRYYAYVLQIDSIKTTGKIALNIAKDSSSNILKTGEIYYAKSSIDKPNKPLNPYTFDYSNYLENNGITHTASLNFKAIHKIGTRYDKLKIIAIHWRESLEEKLKEHHFNTDELAIINAIVLGERQGISKDLREKYAQAGAIHILAVSGLHVGILFLILNFLFGFIERISKNGALIKTVLIITIMILYALLTGLSGSVVRAVTMFSFISIGLLMKYNESNSLFALITSFFFLVLLYPLYIYDVGFQMSYSAVLGILLFQKKIISLFPKIPYSIPKKIVQLFSVSISATLGTLPLSLYYFHQFPGLFFISNIVIIPFMGIIMGLGLLVVVLAIFNLLPDILVSIYNGILAEMNAFISWIATQEDFLFKDISFSLLLLVGSYIFLFSLYRWWNKQTANRLFPFLGSIIILLGILIYEKRERQTTSSYIIFHKTKESIIGIQKGENLYIYSSIDSFNKLNFIRSYKVKKGIEKRNIATDISNVQHFDTYNILVIDSLGIYQNTGFKPDIVLLRQSPKINMERLISVLQPKTIIADGSNYKSYCNRWKKTCDDKEIPFINTKEDGAFLLHH